MRFVAPALSILFIGAIILGFCSCDHFTCKGSDIDAFLPAFGLSPLGIPALALWLNAVIRRIGRRQGPQPGLWCLAAFLGLCLAGIAGFLVFLFFGT